MAVFVSYSLFTMACSQEDSSEGRSVNFLAKSTRSDGKRVSMDCIALACYYTSPSSLNSNDTNDHSKP